MNCIDDAPPAGAPLPGVPPGPRSASLEERLAGLIVRIAGRDESAFADFYDATIGRVHAVALRVCANRENAEEVVMDVYQQVWRDAARYDAVRAGVQTWLLLICRSRALDTLRRQDRAISHPDPTQLVEPQPDSGGDLQDLLEATHNAARVHAALASLSPLRRQLLALAFFRDCTHSEIARSTGLPLGTVKTHIREALRQLRDQWT